ncbi:MAG: hypothetical protein ACOCRK_03515 [bacterium]
MEKVVLSLMTAIVGAVVGPLISKFLFSENKFSEGKVNNIIDKTSLNYNKINIFISNTIINKEKPNQTKNNPENKVASNSNNLTEDLVMGIILSVTVALILVSLYLKYRLQINQILLISTFFVVSTSMSAIIFLIKKRINIDKDFKIYIAWIIIATIFVPINLYFLNNPLYLNEINKVQILNMMENQGWGFLISEYGFNTLSFLSYQVIGILVLILFILHIFLGTLHTWSVVNLYTNIKCRKLWELILKITYVFVPTGYKFIQYNIYLLITTFLLCSGLLYLFLVFGVDILP